MPEVRSLREHADEARRAPTPNDPPKRIGRLETPGPPVSVIQGASPRAKGRGASLGELPGATRGTGVRSRSIGKQKSVERIGFALRALPQGSPQEGKPATRKPPRSADAEDGSPSPTRDGQRAAARPRAARREAVVAEALERRPALEHNGAQASCLNVTGTAWHMALSDVERRRVCAAETPRGSAEADREVDTMEGASSRSSIFSLERRWLLSARGRWNDSGLSVQRTSRAPEQRAGP